jgi:hypothetical protein
MTACASRFEAVLSVRRDTLDCKVAAFGGALEQKSRDRVAPICMGSGLYGAFVAFPANFDENLAVRNSAEISSSNNTVIRAR